MAVRTDAIERVYRERYVRFRNGVASISGSQESARDAVQEGFARAVAQRKQFRGDPSARGALEGWIWRITLRAALELRGRAEQGDVGSQLLDPVLIDEERDPELGRALRQLPPKRRLIVFLRYFADLSYAEIAVACGISEGTVAAALAQAREMLRTELQRDECLASQGPVAVERS